MIDDAHSKNCDEKTQINDENDLSIITLDRLTFKRSSENFDSLLIVSFILQFRRFSDAYQNDLLKEHNVRHDHQNNKKAKNRSHFRT